MPETGELSQQNIKDRYYGYVMVTELIYFVVMILALVERLPSVTLCHTFI